MTHWAEGQARTNLRDDLGDREAKGVRAFVAVRMNDQVEEAVAKTIDELKRPHDGVRWVPRANLHITLKFLGPSVDSHRLQRLTGGLRQLAAKTAPFEVSAVGVGGFPNLEHPRAIWVGLRSVESGALAALAARLETVAAEHGFIDDVIEPHQTRPMVIRALRMLATKVDTMPRKKHGNIPL